MHRLSSCDKEEDQSNESLELDHCDCDHTVIIDVFKMHSKHPTVDASNRIKDSQEPDKRKVKRM